MKETNKWSVRDVITTVLLSAVLIVIQLVVNMVCMANDFVSMVLSVSAILSSVNSEKISALEYGLRPVADTPSIVP